MRTLRASDRTIRIEATPKERLWLIGRMMEVHDLFQRHQEERLGGMLKIQLESAWLDLPLSGSTFLSLIGRSYHVLTRHKLRSRTPHRYGTGRLRGHLDPEDLQSIHTVIQAMADRRKVSRNVLDQLLGPQARSDRSLVMKLLGFSRYLVATKYENTEEGIVDPYHLLERQNRPRGTGHPDQGQGAGQGQHTNPFDDEPGDGEEVTQPDHVGETAELERTAYIEQQPDPDQAGLADDAGTSTEDVPESEKEFLALAEIGPAPPIEGIDESGDSYLEDLGFQGGSDVLADYQPWEQDVED